eukprot:Hpha_TRINITY_DN4805_c0_g1::TRINITY_DN4805_c0_g1_i1::g.20321::m.20321/K08493/VTI1; vesicle transport through interaction with t-SNAREs 1
MSGREDAEAALEQAQSLGKAAEDGIAELLDADREERRQKAASIRVTLKRAHEAIRLANNHALTMPTPERPGIRDRSNAQRKGLRELERRLTVILRNNPADARHELLRTSIGGDDPEAPASEEERRRMLESGSTALVGTAATLDRIEAMTAEGEAVGANTLGNLRRQRDTIGNATRAAVETQQAAGAAGDQIGLIRRALVYNLCTQICLVLALIGAIVMVTYLKWIR